MFNKIIFLPVLFFLIFSCNEKDEEKTASGYDQFYDLHVNDKGVTTIGMPVFIFKLFVITSSSDVKKTVDHIETIDLFVKENSDDNYINEVSKHFPSKTYKTFMTANNQESDLKFWMKEKNETADELVALVNDKENNNCVLLRIGGTFKIKDLENLAEKIDISEIAKYR